jgi:hypothetical protein
MVHTVQLVHKQFVINVGLNHTIPTALTDDRTKDFHTLLHSLSPRTNYTDRATAACRRSECQLLRIEGATWSA